MGSAKNELLKWLNSIGINVKDLTHDWSDGKQICNLLNKIRDGLIPQDKIGVPLLLPLKPYSSFSSFP